MSTIDNTASAVSSGSNAAPVPQGDSSAAPVATTGAASVSRIDPSLLQQITSQQREIQDLLTERRENAARIKNMEEALQKQKEEYTKKHEELYAAQRVEMQQKFDALVQGWAQELAKSNPKMFEDIKGGCSKVISDGDKKDKMWELMCCASELHHTNVKTIENLTQANILLKEQNVKLEDMAQKQQGFSANPRLEKRPRLEESGTPSASYSNNSNSNNAVGLATVPDYEHGGPTELWAAFARRLHEENSYARY